VVCEFDNVIDACSHFYCFLRSDQSNMPAKKNYSVEKASARDIDELVRKHTSESTDAKASSEEEASNQCKHT
jgi:hypothetical protein